MHLQIKRDNVRLAVVLAPYMGLHQSSVRAGTVPVRTTWKRDEWQA